MVAAHTPSSDSDPSTAKSRSIRTGENATATKPITLVSHAASIGRRSARDVSPTAAAPPPAPPPK